MEHRPKMDHIGLNRSVFDQVKGEFFEYCDTPQEAEELAKVEDDVVESSRHACDGFAMTKNLENRGWEGSSELVEICDTFLSKRFTAYRMMVAQWSLDCGIIMDKNIGDEIIYRGKTYYVISKSESSKVYGISTDRNSKSGFPLEAEKLKQ